MDIDWRKELLDQIDWHWRGQLRPRLDGLTDEEYFWEPVPDCWSLRPRDSGGYRIDFAVRPPDPTPVTTIAWRLAHIIIGVYGARNASHFGGPAVDYDTFPYAGTATQALIQLDNAYGHWVEGMRTVDLTRPCGPGEGPYAEFPLASLMLHLNREAIHHGAEIALLRDLYRHAKGGTIE